MVCGPSGRALLIANLTDGKTIRFDLSVDEDLQRWSDFVADSNGRITALAISTKKNLHTFPRPESVSDYGAEILRHVKTGEVTAERIWCHCGKVRIMLTVYIGKTPVSRIDVLHLGEMRFRPGR